MPYLFPDGMSETMSEWCVRMWISQNELMHTLCFTIIHYVSISVMSLWIYFYYVILPLLCSFSFHSLSTIIFWDFWDTWIIHFDMPHRLRCPCGEAAEQFLGQRTPSEDAKEVNGQPGCQTGDQNMSRPRESMHYHHFPYQNCNLGIS